MKRLIAEPRAPFTTLLDDVLTQAECEALIERVDALSPAVAPITTARGFEMRPDIRNNERVIFDDPALALALFERLGGAVPAGLEDRDAEPLGRPCGLNERFRGYRYSPGQRFAPHFDGAFVRSPLERSELTVLLYLNDGFTGGETAFCDWDVSVAPRRGRALLFEHLIRHEGCEVRAGRKYVLRTRLYYADRPGATSVMMW